MPTRLERRRARLLKCHHPPVGVAIGGGHKRAQKASADVFPAVDCLPQTLRIIVIEAPLDVFLCCWKGNGGKGQNGCDGRSSNTSELTGRSSRPPCRAMAEADFGVPVSGRLIPRELEGWQTRTKVSHVRNPMDRLSPECLRLSDMKDLI